MDSTYCYFIAMRTLFAVLPAVFLHSLAKTYNFQKYSLTNINNTLVKTTRTHKNKDSSFTLLCREHFAQTHTRTRIPKAKPHALLAHPKHACVFVHVNENFELQQLWSRLSKGTTLPLKSFYFVV